MKFNADGYCNGACGVAAEGYYDAVEKTRNLIQRSDNNFGYCGNSRYDFNYSEQWTYGPFTCTFADFEEVWSKTVDTMFFTTAEARTESRSFTAPEGSVDDAGCHAAFASMSLECPGGSAKYSSARGRCVCTETVHDFKVAIEHASVVFDHSFTSMYGLDLKSASGVLPRTIVRLADCRVTSEGACDLMEFKKGDTIMIPVQTMLSNLGVDLDGNSCDQNGGLPSNRVGNVCPKVRVSGMQIDVSLAYYNFNQHHTTWGLGLGSDDPVCIMEIAPKLTWTSLGNQISYNSHPVWANSRDVRDASESTNRYRYGIRLNFKGGFGKISKFSFSTLCNTLVQGMFLLFISKKITLWVATHCFGTVSNTYSAVIEERLTFAKEAARFACQALSAYACFKSIDVNEDGVLSKDELFHKLSQVLASTHFQPEAIQKLTEAVFEVLDTRGEESGLLKKDVGRSIDLLEFVDILTEDKISIDTLRHFGEPRRSGEIRSRSTIVEPIEHGLRAAGGNFATCDHPEEGPRTTIK